MKRKILERVDTDRGSAKYGKWQDNMASGRKIKSSGEIWQVAWKYGKWQEKINVQENMVSSRKSKRSSEIWPVTGKYGMSQEKIVCSANHGEVAG